MALSEVDKVLGLNPWKDTVYGLLGDKDPNESGWGSRTPAPEEPGWDGYDVSDWDRREMRAQQDGSALVMLVAEFPKVDGFTGESIIDADEDDGRVTIPDAEPPVSTGVGAEQGETVIPYLSPVAIEQDGPSMVPPHLVFQGSAGAAAVNGLVSV